ncbi:MAG: DNA-binding protein [Candidatus Hecatellaceae archaeon]|nr:MAG: DNA-binding protein [Candidatus Hecatellales archaeon]
MSYEAPDEELEKIKRQRLLELQRKAAEEERLKAELEKQAALRIVLTPEARQRIANIKIVRPEFAEQLENQLLQLAQAGRLPVPVTDEQLKRILEALTSKRRDISIRRI